MLNIKTFSYENDEHLFGPGKRLLIFVKVVLLDAQDVLINIYGNLEQDKILLRMKF